MEHNDDILCIDVHGDLAVTGQIGPKPSICVWDMNTMEAQFLLKGVLEKGIVNVCFSPDGKKIAASALNDDHNIAVYDIDAVIKARLNPSSKKDNVGLIATGKGSKADILDLRFTSDGNTLIAACFKEIYFIEIDAQKKILKSSKGLFGSSGGPQPVLSIALLGTYTCVTGFFINYIFFMFFFLII